MVIIGLLLIALICLTLGLILQSSVWLIASLIATGGAAYLLYRLRHVIAVPKDKRQPLPPELPDAVAKEAVVPARTPATRIAADDADTDEADADDDTDVPVAEADAELPVAEADAELPAAEADAELPAAEADAEDDRVVADDEVWVIDGRPRYHLGDCAIIKGQDAEPIPYDQATEDGFMPCSLCEPHAVSHPQR
jgi:hypothetical protein